MQMLKRAARPREDERGAVAILVAASLMMLMGFAAMTVDVGAAFGERRQDQSASDMAAMAAVQFATGTDVPSAAAAGGLVARDVATANLDSPVAPADWTSCSDADKLEVESSISPCISFSGNLQKARVVIPTIDVDTTFGRALGIDSIATSAAAVAQADLGQQGMVLPFGIEASSAGATEVCLKDGPGGHAEFPCNGPDAGNFGFLDFGLYGNLTLKTEETCGNAKAPDKLKVNMAIGVDHPIGVKDGEFRSERTSCPVFNAKPNHVDGQPGNVSGVIWDGMVGGPSKLIDGSPVGRLARDPEKTVDSSSPRIDNTPLWAFLDGSGNPASCGNVASSPTPTAAMATCIEDWKAGPQTDPLFSITIQGEPRFGAVPLLDQDWGPNKKDMGIVALLPIYVQATMWDCNGTGCNIIHFPGDDGASKGVDSNGKKKLEMMSAFVLDVDMLPEPLRSNFPSTAEQVDYALVK